MFSGVQPEPHFVSAHTQDLNGGSSLLTPAASMMALFDLLPVGVYACEAPTGRIRWFNRHAVQLWGRTPVLGQSEERFCGSYRLYTLDGTYLPHAETPAALVMQTGVPLRGQEVVIERPDGTRIVVLVNLEPVFASNGSVAGFINVFQNITGRKAMEEELRRNQQHLQLLTDHIPQFVWEADNSGRVCYWNAAAVEYIGAANTIGGMDWKNNVHSDDVRATEQAWLTARDRGQSYEVEHRLRGHDGVYRWFLTRALPLHGPDGVLCRWCGTSTDIEAKKRIESEQRAIADALRVANAALRRANYDLEQFAYAAAHDLREPLRNMSLYAQVLDRAHAGDLSERARVSLRYITDSAKRMDTLVRDLLLYAQAVETGGTFTPSSLRDAIDAAKAILRLTIDESQTQIVFEGSDVQVYMRQPHLDQLMQNLIGNAIKYRRRGVAPLIHVRAETTNGRQCISVTDNGIGIHPDYSERIFGVFKRLHGGDIEGTGIGLAICKRIVEHYEGRIWVDAELDQGSTFFFALPLVS